MTSQLYTRSDHAYDADSLVGLYFEFRCNKLCYLGPATLGVRSSFSLDLYVANICQVEVMTYVLYL